MFKKESGKPEEASAPSEKIPPSLHQYLREGGQGDRFQNPYVSSTSYTRRRDSCSTLLDI